MSRLFKYSVVGVGFFLLTSPLFASIESECSGNHAHAVHVCEYIFQQRKAFESYKPPKPIVSLTPVDVTSPALEFNAPEGGTNTGGEKNSGFKLF